MSDHTFQRLGLLLLVMLGVGCDGSSNASENAIPTSLVELPNNYRSVPFLTLRNLTGDTDPVDYFGDERDQLRSGNCDLEFEPIEILKPLADSVSIYIPEETLDVVAVRETDQQTFWSQIRHTANGKRPVMYLHGYNISFERGCRRASLLQKAVGLEGRFLMFGWPSDGAVLNYTRDEADLYWSVKPLMQTIQEMTREFGPGGFDIVAHSLGTRGVFMALIQLANGSKHHTPLVNQLVLVAPDIDAGIFTQYSGLLRQITNNITIYTSSHDNPLKVSREVHGYPRLGESGKHLNKLEGMDIIDVSDIGVRYVSGHLYHLYHEMVAEDLQQLLTHNLPVEERQHLFPTNHSKWRLMPGE
ncbi:MAG: alpha/beta hydrolase [bacterium]